MARRHRKKDGAMRECPEPAVDDVRAATIRRLVEQADDGDVSAAALLVVLHLTREQRRDLVLVADALEGSADLEHGDDDAD
jgi:hypothetical protein